MARQRESTRGAIGMLSRPLAGVCRVRTTVHFPGPSLRCSVTVPRTGDPSAAVHRMERRAECSSTIRFGPVSRTVLT